MSISVGGLVLAQAASPNMDTILFGSFALIALVIGWIVGAVRPGRIAGPLRLPDDSAIFPLTTVLFGSFGFYYFTFGVIAQIWPWLSNRFEGRSSELADSALGTALAAGIPPIVGLIGMGIGDRAIFPLARQKLGMALRLMPRGILRGVLASLIVMPLMFFASDIMDHIYRSLHYTHDQEHPLLRVMEDSPSLFVRVALIIGACVIAPIWEEAFFRGHLQTLLRQVIGQLGGERHAALTSWVAVLLTSALFAMLHPRWSIPIIFLLALCLGYAYERTGNLWIAIAMHATFNIVNTLLSLLTHGGAN
jgi:membrane protease YdiL (CAAX protease family)